MSTAAAIRSVPGGAAKSQEHGHGGGGGHGADTRPADVSYLTPAQKQKLVTLGGVLAAVGVAATGVSFAMDRARFPYVYLAAFAWFTTIGLGALMFVLIQHLTRSGWSVAARRQAEWISSGLLPVSAVLFLPVVVYARDLYHAWMGPEAAQDLVVQKKVAYLNSTAFYGRAIFFFIAWTGVSWWFAKTSREQDDKGGTELHSRMQGASAPAILVTALTLTFAAFDWLMSLDPHWYSTMFGVYIFAGSMVSAHCVIVLITITLQGRGFFHRISTVEHQHDTGKLLFGWIVFYAYITFSQYFLIWYANIPEETIFFKHRTLNGWGDISWLILFGHFAVPFVVLLSRHAKRSKVILGTVAVWMLFMHWVDMYWLVVPNKDVDFHLQWTDVAAWLGPIGVACLVLALKASGSALYPLKDPFIPETLTDENF